MDNVSSKTVSSNDEIDLIALAKTWWNGRRIVFRSVILFGIVGLLMAIFSPKEYTATSIMVPSGNDTKLGGLGSLGGLAAMAGINLSAATGGSDLSPVLYPQIVSSIPFRLALMETPLTFEGHSSPIKLIDYYTKVVKPNPFVKYTIGLPGVLLKLLKSEEKSVGSPDITKVPIELTPEQKMLIESMSQMINLSVNSKEGYLTLTTTMPEGLAAAQLGQKAQELLQQYIIEFKVKKSKANLDFIEQRYNESAEKFEFAQSRLALFRDRNKNVSMESAKTEEQRLNSEYNLIYSIYSELAKQLEQARIQVKQDTPVFTIIEPVTVPIKKSKPNRPLVLFAFTFLGFVVGTVCVYLTPYLTVFKKNWSEIN